MQPAAERAKQTARRKAIYEERHPETKHGAAPFGGHTEESGKVCNFASTERRVGREAEEARPRSKKSAALGAAIAVVKLSAVAFRRRR